MKIGIVIGSIREGRVGEGFANWVAEKASEKAGPDTTFEIVDLKDYDLPQFNGPVVPRMLNKQYSDAKVQEFSNLIDSYDGFIFVTPEYNHSVPSALKNAIDNLAPEWEGKPVGFVGYSYNGALDAMSHLRTIMSGLAAPVATQVSFNLGTDVVDGAVQGSDQHEADLAAMVAELTSK